MTFTLNESAAREWLTKVVAGNEDGDYDDDLTIESDWDPREVGSESQLDDLVRIAQENGSMTNDADATVYYSFEGSPDMEADYFSFLVDLRIPGTNYGTLRITSGSEEMRRIGGPDARGVEGALSVLRDAVMYANSALRNLSEYVAAQPEGK